MELLWNRERSNQLDRAVYHYDLEEERSEDSHFEYWHRRMVHLRKCYEDRTRKLDGDKGWWYWRWFVVVAMAFVVVVLFGMIG